MVRLVERRYEPAGSGIGGGGTEIFTFQPIRTGRALVTFEYKRPWDKAPAEKQDFQLRIEE
jgi:predicted secreted protein